MKEWRLLVGIVAFWVAVISWLTLSPRGRLPLDLIRLLRSGKTGRIGCFGTCKQCGSVWTLSYPHHWHITPCDRPGTHRVQRCYSCGETYLDGHRVHL